MFTSYTSYVKASCSYSGAWAWGTFLQLSATIATALAVCLAVEQKPLYDQCGELRIFAASSAARDVGVCAVKTG